MGNYKKNPEQPFEVKVPNKIRKCIMMHEREKNKMLELGFIKPLKVSPLKVRGSMWSRFTGWVKGDCK